MTKLHTLFTGVGISIVIAAGLVSQPAFAAVSPANGLSVSPAINNIQLLPNQTSASFNEVVTNVTSNELAVAIAAKDFGALNASGSIGFYGASYKPSTNQHSLSSSIVLPTDEILLEPHQTQTFTLTIDNVSQLSPGGHYSALLFTPAIARSGTSTNQVSLQPSVASLIFVTTSSGGTQSISLSGLGVGRIGFVLPSTVYVTLANNGNTQVIPRGVVTLKDPVANVVSQTVLNNNSGLILPGTSRLFSAPLTTRQSLFKPAGIYHIQVKYRVDGSSAYQTTTKSFLYLNPLFLVYIAAIVLIVKLIWKFRKKLKSIPKYLRRRFKKPKTIRIKVKHQS